MLISGVFGCVLWLEKSGKIQKKIRACVKWCREEVDTYLSSEDC